MQEAQRLGMKDAIVSEGGGGKTEKKMYEAQLKINNGNVEETNKILFKKFKDSVFEGRSSIGSKGAEEEAAKTGKTTYLRKLGENKAGEVEFALNTIDLVTRKQTEKRFTTEGGLNKNDIIARVSKASGISADKILATTEISDLLFEYPMKEIDLSRHNVRDKIMKILRVG